MVGAPVTIGMRVLASDGLELGLVEEIAAGHFLVREPGSENRRQFKYTDIQSVRSYVQLSPPAKKPRRKLLDRLRARKPRRG